MLDSPTSLPGSSLDHDPTCPTERAIARLDQLEQLLDMKRRKRVELTPLLCVLTEEGLRLLPNRPWYYLDVAEAFETQASRKAFDELAPTLIAGIHGIAGAVVSEAWTLDGTYAHLDLEVYEAGRASGVYQHLGEFPGAGTVVMVLYQDPEITMTRTYKVHPPDQGNGLVLPAYADSHLSPLATEKFRYDLFPQPMRDRGGQSY